MRSLTAHQERLLKIIRAEGSARVQRTLEQASLAPEEMEKLTLAEGKLQWSALIHHARLRDRHHGKAVIDTLLDIGRTLNIIEAGNFPGGIYDRNFRSRIMNEFKIYGASRETQMIFWHMQDWERPSYAVLDYRGSYTSVPSLTYFGHYRFVAKPALIAHATFTPSDSFQVERDQVYTWEHLRGVLATKLTDHFWYEYVLADAEPFVCNEGIHYIEAQILGGFELSDFARLYYPAADRSDRRFFSKLRRFELEHGVELVYY